MKEWYWNNAKGYPFSFRISTGFVSPCTRRLRENFSGSSGTEERSKIINSLKLKKLTANTIITKEDLEKRYYLLPKMGLRLITRRNSKGQVCVGAPVLGKNAKLVGSVWLVAPTSRLPKKNISETAQKVMAAADKISQALGNQFRKVA